MLGTEVMDDEGIGRMKGGILSKGAVVRVRSIQTWCGIKVQASLIPDPVLELCVDSCNKNQKLPPTPSPQTDCHHLILAR